MNKAQHNSYDDLLNFVTDSKDGYKTNLAAYRWLASIAIEGKIVPEAVCMPMPDADSEYNGEIIRQEDIRASRIKLNQKIVEGLNKKGEKIYTEGGVVSAEKQKRIEDFLLRGGSINGYADVSELDGHADTQYDKARNVLKDIAHKSAAEFIKMQDEDLKKPAKEYLAYLALQGKVTGSLAKNEDMVRRFDEDAERIGITYKGKISEAKQKILKEFLLNKDQTHGEIESHSLKIMLDSVQEIVNAENTAKGKEEAARRLVAQQEIGRKLAKTLKPTRGSSSLQGRM